MAEVVFYPANRSIVVEEGTSILQAARLAGVLIESPCNCSGTCRKCRVKLVGESLQHVQQKGMLNIHDISLGIVLSCETVILADISVEVFTQDQYNPLQVNGEACPVELEPFIRKIFSETEQITKVYAGDSIFAIEAGNTVCINFGVVIDIGTTTLAAALIDLTTGDQIAVVSELNPQSHYAQDVMSRIKFASQDSGLHEMFNLLITKINCMIEELKSVAGVDAGSVYEVIFSGNTCMLHLAMGLNPVTLGKYPYIPLTYGDIYKKASDCKLLMADDGLIYAPPIISAYIGADISSGILATSLHQRQGVNLLVDIGTNGEIVMGFDGILYATSAAAGPAFEGMNITCGMRAARGAVEAFTFDEKNGISFGTIGSTIATGICGSGLLDIVGELVAHGVISRNGRFKDPCSGEIHPLLQERLVLLEGRIAFKITENIFLTQEDVRQVQLAKGALRAGIEMLLKETGNVASAVDRIFIAGSFGYHLRGKNLLEVGLLPAEFAGKIDFVGNTSLFGGQALLLNRSLRTTIAEVVKNIRVIEPGQYKDFDRLFVSCLAF